VHSKFDGDFTPVMFHEAIVLFREKFEHEPTRLLIGSGYRYSEILETIFFVRTKLDLPFEVSYALQRDAWILIDDDGNIFYSPGA
jgi:hypothetical protein